MPEQPRDSRPGDPRVNAALADYLQRIDRGEQVAVEQFLAGHADIAGELRSLLITSDELAQLRPADSPAPPPVPEASTRSVAEQNVETIAPKRVQDAAAKETFLQRLPDKFGRYRIIRPLGSGAMGDVYLAEDSQLHRQVALKTPSFDEDETGELLERFYREARSAAGLRHSHICPVFDVGEINGRHYISMAYIEGQPLSAYIRPDKPQPERQALAVIRKLALAIQEAHDHGIIHRDLKPGNVMIDRKTEPIVMDFGLARPVQSEQGARLTQSGMLVGSPAYMSPEQVEGETDKLSPATDQYSLGVILYELLTGSLPFRGGVTALIAAILTKEPKPPSQLRSDLDPRIEALCLKMMAKSPRDRYPSMRAVAEAIAGILKSEPVPAEPDKTAAAETPDSKPRAKRSSSRIQPVPAAAVPAAAVSITASNVESLFDAATKCMRKHDYEQVVQLLDAIPDSKRNDQVRALLMKARELADEVAFLIAEIDEALRLNDNEALAKKADALLKLKPKHHKALQIKEELSRYGSGRLRSSRGWTPDGSRIGEGSWIPWLPLSLFAGVFGLTLLMVTLYLRVGDAVVRVQITDPNVEVGIQDRTLNVKSANQDIKVDPGEDTLKIAYNGAEFETDKFTLKQGENPALVIELLDKTLSAKFGDLSIGQWPVEMSPPQNPAAEIAPRNGDVRQSNDDVKQRRDAASFAAGTVWKGKRAYRKGAYAPSNVTYELHVKERNGNQFQGHVFDNGPGRNRAEVEGTIEGTTINWRERSIFNRDNEMTMQGTLDGNVIHVKFTGYYGANRPTNEGDGELTLDAAAQPSAKPTPVPPDAVAYQGHSYKYFGERLSWKEAKARCESMGGHLPIVETAAENAFLDQMALQNFPAATNKEAVWIGATDEVKEGEWKWVNGSSVTYANWLKTPNNGPGTQPNNKGGVEHYALIWLSSDPNRASGHWSDQPNVSEQHIAHFICEWDELRVAPAVQDAAGWTELFNGRDLAGWDVIRGLAPPQSPLAGMQGWEIQDGVLKCMTGEFLWLRTNREYQDFALSLEFQLPPQGAQTGVYFRNPGNRTGWDGMMAQIVSDNSKFPANMHSGGITKFVAPAVDAMRPAGQWNSMEIECRGRNVRIVVNGQVTVDVDTTKTTSLSDRPQSGYIGLVNYQGEANGAAFRNIRIRPIAALTDEKRTAATPALQGTWTAVAQEIAGTVWTDQQIKEHEKTITFDDNRFEIRYRDRTGQFQIERGTYELDLAHDPAHIDMNGTNRDGGVIRFSGIYQIEGTELRHCFVKAADNSIPARPKRFSTTARSGQFSTTYRRDEAASAAVTNGANSDWTDLFKGNNLTGWHTAGDATWSVKNGVLTGAPGDGWIATDREYDNFELQLEYRLAPGANSGVFLRIPEQGALGGNDFLEVQLIDQALQPVTETWQRTGAVYAVQGPATPVNAAAGQWHPLTIRAVGPDITVSLGGNEINRVNLDTAPVLGSPKRDLHRASGHIGFQHRAKPVEFRNIRIRKL